MYFEHPLYVQSTYQNIQLKFCRYLQKSIKGVCKQKKKKIMSRARDLMYFVLMKHVFCMLYKIDETCNTYIIYIYVDVKK